MSEHWQPLAQRLVADIKAIGALHDPQWERAFAQTPRHVFVPRFFVNRWASERKPGWRAVGPDDTDWLETVYSTQGLFTQFDGDPEEWARRRVDPERVLTPAEDGFIRGRITSSSSEPPLMARMLDALDVTDGHRVLEVGTGSGYNAALLCHRLGDSNVTSIDIDPHLIAEARTRLASLDYHPRLEVADATRKVPPGPYDRVLVTVGMGHIPPQWLRETTPGAVILVHFQSTLEANGIYALTTSEGSALGPNVLGGVFMPTRDRYQPTPYELRDRARTETGTTVPAQLPATAITDYGDFHDFLSLHLRDVGQITWEGATWLVSTDGSWAYQRLDTPDTATQGGPRHLWSQAEQIWHTWNQLGSPGRDRFGISVRPDGTHLLWVDDPTTVATELP